MKNKTSVFLISLLAFLGIASCACAQNGATIVFGANGRIHGRDCSGTGVCVLNGSAPCCKGTYVTFAPAWLPIPQPNCNNCGVSLFFMIFSLSDAVKNANFLVPADSVYNFTGGGNLGSFQNFPTKSFTMPNGTTGIYNPPLQGADTANIMLQPVYWSPATGYTLTDPFSQQVSADAMKKWNAAKASKIAAMKKGKKK